MGEIRIRQYVQELETNILQTWKTSFKSIADMEIHTIYLMSSKELNKKHSYHLPLMGLNNTNQAPSKQLDNISMKTVPPLGSCSSEEIADHTSTDQLNPGNSEAVIIHEMLLDNKPLFAEGGDAQIPELLECEVQVYESSAYNPNVRLPRDDNDRGPQEDADSDAPNDLVPYDNNIGFEMVTNDNGDSENNRKNQLKNPDDETEKDTSSFSLNHYLQINEPGSKEEEPTSAALQNSCSVCNKQFVSKRNLRMHLKNHLEGTNEVASKQQLTGEALDEKIALIANLSMDMKNLSNVMEDDEKGQSDLDETKPEYDLKINIPGQWKKSRKKSRTCSYCLRVFVDSNTLRRHLNGRSPYHKIKCPMCVQKFPSMCLLNSHKRNQHPEDQNTTKKKACSNCNQEFFTSSGLRRHLNGRPPYTKLKCPHCSDRFTSRCIFKVHIEKKHPGSSELLTLTPKLKKGTSLQICRSCEKIFSSTVSLFKHLQGQPPYREYSCTECTEKLRSQCSLNEHMKDKHQIDSKSGDPIEYEIICPSCDDRLSTEALFEKHMEVKHRGQTASLDQESIQNPCTCELCGKIFNTAAALTRHVNGRPPFPDIQCHLCPEIVKSKCRLRYHIQKKHDPGFDYFFSTRKCHLCVKSFAKVGLLKVHLIECHNIEPPVKKGKVQLPDGPPYKCLECDNVSPNLSQWKLHRAANHLEKQYMCEICSKAFTSPGRLKQHLILAHGMDPEDDVHVEGRISRHYKCSDCDKTFQSSSGLIKHQRHHTGNMFTCDKCAKQFPTNYSLKSHLEAKHMPNSKPLPKNYTSGPPYQCSYEGCTKVSNTMAQFRHHFITHSRDNMLRCPHCDKGFWRKFLLEEHIAVTHRGERYHCFACSKPFKTRAKCKLHMEKQGHQTMEGIPYRRPVDSNSTDTKDDTNNAERAKLDQSADDSELTICLS